MPDARVAHKRDKIDTYSHKECRICRESRQRQEIEIERPGKDKTVGGMGMRVSCIETVIMGLFRMTTVRFDCIISHSFRNRRLAGVYLVLGPSHDILHRSEQPLETVPT